MSTRTRSNKPTPEAPSHLVISLEDGPSVEEAVQSVTGRLAPVARAASARAAAPEGVELLSSRRSGGAQGAFFREFNIAAVDLDAGEAAQIRQENVLVVPNELRYIEGGPSASWRRRPAPEQGAERRLMPLGEPGETAPQETEYSAECSGHRCFPFAAPPLVEGAPGGATGNLEAFIQGQQEALASILRRLRSEPQSALGGAVPIEPSADREWHLQAIGLGADDYRWTGKGIKVAVLDTGLDLNHPDFVGRISAANCRSFVPGARDVSDGNGHGTHCCGLINGPMTPNDGPRYGVAPDAELLVGKVLSDAGEGYDSWIISGIAWAAARGARVISLSLGSRRGRDGAYAAAYEHLARKLARRGQDCLLVAAAGNASDRRAGHIAPVGNPAACPAFMGVAAIDSRFKVADFSCGEVDRIGTLELSAPGVAVRSSIPVARAGDSGPYDLFDGTSMATPIAAGAAALWLQSQPGRTALELWRDLIRSARPLESRRDYGFGLVRVP